MLAAATRILAMTQTRVASPPWGNRLHTITRSYSLQQQPVMLRQSLLAHQSALGLRSVSTANAISLAHRYNTCDLSCGARIRRFQVFSSWGSHHRHKSQAQCWPITCQPFRSLFLSSRKKEEEEDRRASVHHVSKIQCHAGVHDAHWICFLVYRQAMGFLAKAGGSAIAPPAPLSEKETRAFARELHTVNVGKAPDSPAPYTWKLSMSAADIIVQFH